LQATEINRKSILDNNDVCLFNRNKYALFDIETTGLSHLEDDILEICVIPYKFGEANDQYHSLVKTNKQIPKSITSINKLTNAMVMNAPGVQHVLNEVYSKFSDYILVAHNAHNFDAKFLISKGNLLFENFRFLDTLPLAKHVLPGLDNYTMSRLTGLFGIEIHSQHTAMGDTSALVKLFRKLLVLLDDDVEQFIITGEKISKKTKERKEVSND
jgi:DNA polymerase III alpha subunit (gram-positive type)